MKSVLISAKAKSHVHKGKINISKQWSLIKEWALAKRKFRKHFFFAQHSLFCLPIHSINFCSLATSFFQSHLRISMVCHRPPNLCSPVFHFIQPMPRCQPKVALHCSPCGAHVFWTPILGSYQETHYLTSSSYPFFKANLNSAPLPTLPSLLVTCDHFFTIW